jgi:hypothetical protein
LEDLFPHSDWLLPVLSCRRQAAVPLFSRM